MGHTCSPTYGERYIGRPAMSVNTPAHWGQLLNSGADLLLVGRLGLFFIANRRENLEYSEVSMSTSQQGARLAGGQVNRYG